MPRDPRVPNMPGFRDVFRCTRCGAIEGLESGRRPRAPSATPICTHALSAPTSTAGATFECMQAIPARVSPKDVRNTCTFYSPRVKVERETGSSVPASGAKKAFDDLFKF